MISIVVPVLNEEESLHAFYGEVEKIVPTLHSDYELIFIDDGSTDSSLEILKSLTEKNKRVRIFSFRRNLGKAEALTFGFAKAKGDYLVTLDADLQDRPSEIHKLLAKCKEGTELVCGWRQNQKRPKHMILISKVFNTILQYIFELKIHDYNCGLKVMTKDAAKSLRLYGGLHRFIPLIAYQQGFTVDEVPVEHDSRKFGTSKYGFSKLWKDLPDIFSMIFLAKYSKRPLHFFGGIGMFLVFIGILILLYLVVLHFMGYSIIRRPIIFFGILFVMAGLQILFTGFLADLMINISHSPQMLDENHLHFPLKYTSDKNNH
jgi:glycosyltransferase involved in cell wall biosynthesis